MKASRRSAAEWQRILSTREWQPAPAPKPKKRTKGGQSEDFLQRIFEALDISPQTASLRYNIPLAEILDIYTGGRSDIIAVDRFELWIKIAEHVDDRIGRLISIREELQRKLSADRKQRLAERLRIERR